VTLLRRESRLFQVALVAVQAAVVFHFVSIVEHTLTLGRLPVGNFFETSSLCALLFAVVFLVVYWRYKFVGLSLFVFPLVTVLSVAAAMGAPLAPWANRQVRDVWLLVHIVLVLVGYSALLLSAGAAVFYLIQERQLKRKQTNRSFLGLLNAERIPPLATLDSLITSSMSFGFVVITLAVIAGSTWGFIELKTAWISQPKIAISFFTWGVYLALVCLRVAAGWRGRKAAIMTVVLVGFSALTWAAHARLGALLLKP
jgi:ABC-type uncharacterized transport system permease subunit